MSLLANIPEELKHPDVKVGLIGRDGNVFFIIGTCKQAIRRHHGAVAASQWSDYIHANAENYDEVLTFCMETLDVH